MNPEHDEGNADQAPKPEARFDLPPGDAGDPMPGGAPRTEDELLRVLERMERLMEEVRGTLETREHERRYQEFSVARLAGSVLQALVVGFLIAALADWLFGAAAAAPLVKLAFAGVLQVAALTAFLLARERP